MGVQFCVATCRRASQLAASETFGGLKICEKAPKRENRYTGANSCNLRTEGNRLMTASSTTTGTSSPNRVKDIAALVISIAIVTVVATLGGLASANAGGDYQRLAQPSWAPPS